MKKNAPDLDRIKVRIEQSAVFSLRREELEYSLLVYELMENLYLYAVQLNARQYQDMGLEVVETANRCLKSYDAAKGPFLHYFMTALSRRVKKERALQAEVQRRELTGTQANSEDGETFSFLDRSAGDNDPETEVILLQNGQNLLKELESCFSTCRISQRRVLSKMLTARLLSCLSGDENLRTYSFFDEAVYWQYAYTGQIPTGKDISQQLGKNEASISRTYSQFLKKFKNRSMQNNI